MYVYIRAISINSNIFLGVIIGRYNSSIRKNARQIMVNGIIGYVLQKLSVIPLSDIENS